MRRKSSFVILEAMIDIGYLVIVLAIVLISMTLHEAMHAFVSYWLGDDTAKSQGRVTLNPIAHIDPFMTILLPLLLALSGGPIFGGAKPVPFMPDRVRYEEFGAMLVGVAGPLTNLFIAFLAIVGTVLFGEGLIGDLLQLTAVINLGFFIFNMLPIPPLDGSRVLYYLAPDTIRKMMASMEQFGIFIVFAIVILFSPVLSAFMGNGITTLFEAMYSLVATVL